MESSFVKSSISKGQSVTDLKMPDINWDQYRSKTFYNEKIHNEIKNARNHERPVEWKDIVAPINEKYDTTFTMNALRKRYEHWEANHPDIEKESK